MKASQGKPSSQAERGKPSSRAEGSASQVLPSEASESSASSIMCLRNIQGMLLDTFISFSTQFLYAQLRFLNFPILDDLLCVLQGVPMNTHGPPCTLTLWCPLPKLPL